MPQAALKPCAPADPPDTAQAEPEAAAAPLPPKVLDKIRAQRRKVEGLHAAVMARTDEHRRLREHLQALKISIAQLKGTISYDASIKQVRIIRPAYISLLPFTAVISRGSLDITQASP